MTMMWGKFDIGEENLTLVRKIWRRWGKSDHGEEKVTMVRKSGDGEEKVTTYKSLIILKSSHFLHPTVTLDFGAF